MKTYQIAGLTVTSEIALNAPRVTIGDTAPDVQITLVSSLDHPQQPTLDTPKLKGNARDLWFAGVPGLEFRIREGREVQIVSDPPSTSSDRNLFLIGSAFGVLAFQRGLVPLHISAVECDGRALAVTGHSGAGKSTLATALSQLGFGHFCDDVGIFDPQKAPFEVHAMPKGIKLWDEAADQLEITKGKRVSSIPSLLKTYVQAPKQSKSPVLSLENLYVIDQSHTDTFSITEITGMEKFIEVRRAIYRQEWFEAFFSEAEAFALVAKLAKSVRMYRFTRPRSLAAVSESAAYLVDHFESQKQ